MKQHAYKIIEKNIKAKTLKSPLFFYGREQYLIKWAISSIVDTYTNPLVAEMNFSTINLNTETLEEIRNQCETLPILSEKRVVLCEDFSPLGGSRLKGFSDEDEEDLINYLGVIPDTCILIFTGDKADKRRRLYKAIMENGECYELKELDEGSLKAFIRKRFNSSQKNISATLLNQLITTSGYYHKESEYTLYICDINISNASIGSNTPCLIFLST